MYLFWILPNVYVSLHGNYGLWSLSSARSIFFRFGFVVFNKFVITWGASQHTKCLIEFYFELENSDLNVRFRIPIRVKFAAKGVKQVNFRICLLKCVDRPLLMCVSWRIGSQICLNANRTWNCTQNL
jgi:hypothetical protein